MSIHKRVYELEPLRYHTGGSVGGRLLLRGSDSCEYMKRTRDVGAPQSRGRDWVRTHKMGSQTAAHSDNAQPRMHKANPAHIPPIDSVQSNQKNTSSNSPSSGARARHDPPALASQTVPCLEVVIIHSCSNRWHGFHHDPTRPPSLRLPLGALSRLQLGNCGVRCQPLGLMLTRFLPCFTRASISGSSSLGRTHTLDGGLSGEKPPPPSTQPLMPKAVTQITRMVALCAASTAAATICAPYHCGG
jgi:hypothetical protein